MREKISVALCSYNGSKFIADQLNSILNQTQMPDEIVICDDKSTDDTVQIAKDILEKSNLEYKIEVNESNLGVINNFEKAIVMCSGDIIFTSDQDDVWVETKVEEMVDVFKENNDLLLVFSDAYLTDEDVNEKKHRLWDAINPKIYRLNNCEDYKRMIIKGNIVTGATMAFRKELLIYALPFNQYWIHDHWLAIHSALLGRIRGLNKALIYYRQHEHNVIGMRKLFFFDKISIFFRNLKKIERIREQFHVEYIELLSHIESNSNMNTNEILEYTLGVSNFWDELYSLNSIGFIRGIRVVLGRYFSGSYNYFYTGFRGAFRDCLYLILRKLI